MTVYLRTHRKLIAFAVGGVLLYVQTLLTPTGLAAHIVTGVILFGTGLGVWGARNDLTVEQKGFVLREQARHRASKRPPPEQAGGPR